MYIYIYHIDIDQEQRRFSEVAPQAAALLGSSVTEAIKPEPKASVGCFYSGFNQFSPWKYGQYGDVIGQKKGVHHENLGI